ncbi:MAG: hypothetical protein ABSC32_15105 [Steroidobacteraceae bacterium]
MKTSRRVRCGASQAWAVGLVLCFGARLDARADPPAAEGASAGSASANAESDEPKSLPQDGLFSSIKQNLREGDQEIIRGHFELGSPPNVHRYYCLMDPKTRRREPNGVVGDPIPRPDGMTGIKTSAVSLYRCDKAEQQGMLITSGYMVPARSGGSAAAVPAASAQPAAAAAQTPSAPAPSAPVVAQSPPAVQPAAAAPAAISRFSSGMIDISGVKLGMSPDEVRAVLKSKNLHDHNEWSENLSYREAATGRTQPVANGRFVSVIAASNAAAAAAEGNYETKGESFEVMFTPVPGHERAMAIVHTVGYSPADAIHETALETGLMEKYGGLATAGGLPASATWWYQSGGTVTVGDSCGRRGVLGGLGSLRVASERENISLKQSADDLQFEVQHCGIAIVTEDHYTPNGGALRDERMVTRYTVTAYSPALAFDGAARAAEILRAAGHDRGTAVSAPSRDARAPDL